MTAENLWTPGPRRTRLVLLLSGAGLVVTFALLGAITWAILYIHRDKAQMERVPARIVKVVRSRRDAFGRGLKFGTYTLRVRYRTADGREVDNTVEKATFRFPTEGAPVTLLRNPRSGGLEDDPFPELWVILAAVALCFGGLAGFFGWGITQALGRRAGPAG